MPFISSLLSTSTYRQHVEAAAVLNPNERQQIIAKSDALSTRLQQAFQNLDAHSTTTIDSVKATQDYEAAYTQLETFLKDLQSKQDTFSQNNQPNSETQTWLNTQIETIKHKLTQNQAHKDAQHLKSGDVIYLGNQAPQKNTYAIQPTFDKSSLLAQLRTEVAKDNGQTTNSLINDPLRQTAQNDSISYAALKLSDKYAQDPLYARNTRFYNTLEEAAGQLRAETLQTHINNFLTRTPPDYLAAFKQLKTDFNATSGAERQGLYQNLAASQFGVDFFTAQLNSVQKSPQALAQFIRNVSTNAPAEITHNLVSAVLSNVSTQWYDNSTYGVEAAVQLFTSLSHAANVIDHDLPSLPSQTEQIARWCLIPENLFGQHPLGRFPLPALQEAIANGDGTSLAVAVTNLLAIDTHSTQTLSSALRYIKTGLEKLQKHTQETSDDWSSKNGEIAELAQSFGDPTQPETLNSFIQEYRARRPDQAQQADAAWLEMGHWGYQVKNAIQDLNGLTGFDSVNPPFHYDKIIKTIDSFDEDIKLQNAVSQSPEVQLSARRDTQIDLLQAKGSIAVTDVDEYLANLGTSLPNTTLTSAEQKNLLAVSQSWANQLKQSITSDKPIAEIQQQVTHYQNQLLQFLQQKSVGVYYRLLDKLDFYLPVHSHGIELFARPATTIRYGRNILDIVITARYKAGFEFMLNEGSTNPKNINRLFDRAIRVSPGSGVDAKTQQEFVRIAQDMRARALEMARTGKPMDVKTVAQEFDQAAKDKLGKSFKSLKPSSPVLRFGQFLRAVTVLCYAVNVAANIQKSSEGRATASTIASLGSYPIAMGLPAAELAAGIRGVDLGKTYKWFGRLSPLRYGVVAIPSAILAYEEFKKGDTLQGMTDASFALGGVLAGSEGIWGIFSASAAPAWLGTLGQVGIVIMFVAAAAGAVVWEVKRAREAEKFGPEQAPDLYRLVQEKIFPNDPQAAEKASALLDHTSMGVSPMFALRQLAASKNLTATQLNQWLARLNVSQIKFAAEEARQFITSALNIHTGELPARASDEADAEAGILFRKGIPQGATNLAQTGVSPATPTPAQPTPAPSAQSAPVINPAPKNTAAPKSAPAPVQPRPTPPAEEMKHAQSLRGLDELLKRNRIPLVATSPPNNNDTLTTPPTEIKFPPQYYVVQKNGPHDLDEIAAQFGQSAAQIRKNNPLYDF